MWRKIQINYFGREIKSGKELNTLWELESNFASLKPQIITRSIYQRHGRFFNSFSLERDFKKSSLQKLRLMAFSKDISGFKEAWGNDQFKRHSESTFPKTYIPTLHILKNFPLDYLSLNRNLRASVSTKGTLTRWYIYLISAITACLPWRNLVKTKIRLFNKSKPGN